MYHLIYTADCAIEPSWLSNLVIRSGWSQGFTALDSPFMSMSYYQVLGAEPGADYAEIRRKYLSAVLALHPDRQYAEGLNQEGRGNNILTPTEETFLVDSSSVYDHHRIKELGAQGTRKHSSDNDQFLKVQEAWETLRDPESRARYDKLLSTERLIRQCEVSSRVIGEEVYIEEMDFTEGNVGQAPEYTFPCRCGDCFVVSVEDLAEAGFVTELTSDGRPGSTERITKHPTLQREKMPHRTSLVLPCQSCSLHIRLHLDLDYISGAGPHHVKIPATGTICNLPTAAVGKRFGKDVIRRAAAAEHNGSKKSKL
ncbi:hypothetical protein R1sor_022664 [Riccia sorocarpa]|uniref:Uncharacterized protein n=1 Tax=Riccia sorocarpa TaxID=122646 RepID=A0ABD3GKH6_9MARC